MMNNKRVNFAVGWVRNTKDGSQFISCVANGERQKARLKLELEDGTEVYPENFFVNFTENKTNEKAPDVNFSATVSE